MSCVRVRSISAFDFVLDDIYSKHSQKIAIYFITLQKSASMTTKKFNKFKKEVLRFKIQNNHLFRRNNKNVSLKRIVDNLEERKQIMKTLHDESDHRDREETYKKIVDRY